ncbi:MAG: type II toxin-antitoxin system HigB family toxin [Bacteroidetes bacterium]|nr:type II toxin-antitoxin system HigB family toxin [Bacteroidota bacterium]
MRIIAKRTLREFWEKHMDAEVPLIGWYNKAKKSNWENFNDLKTQIANVSVLGNDRAVFNIKGNDYRLVVAMDYEKQIIWIKFIGSHAEYDKINAKTV